MIKLTTVRNICFIVGVLIFVLLIEFSLWHTADMWKNEFKSEIFGSFWEYYFTRAKGELAISMFFLAMFSALGIYFHCRFCKK